MKKVQMLTVLGSCVFLIAACSNDEAVTVESNGASSAGSSIQTPEAVSSSAIAESVAEAPVVEEPEPVKAAPVSPVGKRSNPVLNGQTASFNLTYYDDAYNKIPANASITLSNPVRGQAAFDALVAQNQFNSPAPEGLEWLIFDVNLTLNEGSPDYAFNSSSIYFKAVGSDGSQVDQKEYGVLDDNFGMNDLYAGGSDLGTKSHLGSRRRFRCPDRNERFQHTEHLFQPEIDLLVVGINPLRRKKTVKVINFLIALVKLLFLLGIGMLIVTTCSNDAPVTVSTIQKTSANRG